jgi:putative hydrolase of the HAD superfamily
VTNRNLLVFDGDDTLWSTEELYDRARSDAAAIAKSVGVDPGRFEQLQCEIDARNVKSMGLSSHRFPTSSVEALRALADEAKIALDAAVESRVYEASAAVFEMRAPMFPNAVEVLTKLASEHPLALCTKGDPTVQDRRIDDSGLRDVFRRILIVPTKDVGTFEVLLREFDARPSASVSIGNSMPSDISPALAVGMHAIWIDAHVWIHERRQSEDMASDNALWRTARDLSEVPAILADFALQSA